MKKSIKRTLKPLVPKKLLLLRDKRLEANRNKQLLSEWKSNGCPAPPPHFVKQMTIKEFQRKSSYKILIETGTYFGDMIDAQKNNFKLIYSIELSVDLFNKAKQKFEKDKNIIILQGDSGKVLPYIIKKIDEPVIFWLDGHYSEGITARGDKDCPIYEELDAILSKNKTEHIILIDDARCFIGAGDYPTIDELTSYVRSYNEKYQVDVKNDIIRFII